MKEPKCDHILFVSVLLSSKLDFIKESEKNEIIRKLKEIEEDGTEYNLKCEYCPKCGAKNNFNIGNCNV